MEKVIKEVTVFTSGDSSKIATWSNVPFFFTDTLISNGIKVNRVDISPCKWKFLHFFFLIAKIFNKHTTYEYSRSFIHFFLTRQRIKKAVKRYKNSDADIFLTFSLSSAGFTCKPVVQFGDWTYDYFFKYIVDRKPDFMEKRSIRREDSQIMKSDLIFPLFPSVTNYMKKRYNKNRIFYIGNVVNSLEESSQEYIHTKKTTPNLLFVGGSHYLEGAKSLIAAFKILRQQFPQLKLHIIGIEKTEFDSLPENIFCYGYLDKGNDNDRKLYYKLFKEAAIYINTTPKWSAFSATIEAMYFYTPVIVTPYDEFVETFGKEINFGFYCEINSPDLIREKIKDVLIDSSYEKLCICAHQAVREFTWSAYIEKLIVHIEQIRREKQFYPNDKLNKI